LFLVADSFRTKESESRALGGRSEEVQSHCRVMAEHLASIFGTEKDRVNCPFYFKIGACRHGDRCSRMHNRPTISPTLLFSNMYQRPDMAISGTDPHAQNMDPRKLQEHFEVTFVFLHNSCFFLIAVMVN
jgi:hypothetical protein